MAPDDPHEPTDPTYECIECGYRDEGGAHSEACPDCGGQMRNINVSREQ